MKTVKKALWGFVFLAALIAIYIFLCKPDQVVDPKFSVVSEKAQAAALPAQQDVAQATPTDQAAAPVAATKPADPAPTTPTCDQSQDVYCYGVYGVDQYGTPIPKVQVTQPAQPWVRSDGYFNYCYQMTDGSWTTVTGQLTLGSGVYYYGGPIDAATQSPAYADQSQAWCAANVPS